MKALRSQLLRDTDWASMAHSLEVRVPMVDIRLLQAIAPLFETNALPGKEEMAATPKNQLPHEIIERGKTGFSIPVQEWLMGDDGATGERGLRGWARRVYLVCTK